MTREQAITQAARLQRERPDVTWKAVPRGADWVVASIGVPPPSAGTGTAVKPPPPAPRAPVQSEPARVATLYGSGG